MEEGATCCTVETPSRLLLFYPDTTPPSISAVLPCRPLCKPVRNRVTLGRSSTADVRLNDERMSRLYAALWHDGKDPFVFRVSNLSERKPLVVDQKVLRQGEEAEIKDGSLIDLDFLQLKVTVLAGDYTAPFYQVAFLRKPLLSPPPQPPSLPSEGKCLVTVPRNVPGFSFGPSFSFSTSDDSGNLSSTTPGDYRAGLLASLYGFKLDDWVCPQSRSDCKAVECMAPLTPGDVGIEYELPENLVTARPEESRPCGACSPLRPHVLDNTSEAVGMNSLFVQPLVTTSSASRGAACVGLDLNIPPPAAQVTHHPHNHHRQQQSCPCLRPEPLPMNLAADKPIETGARIPDAVKSHSDEILPLAQIASKIYLSKKEEHEASLAAPAILSPCTCGTTMANVTSTLPKAEEPREDARALRVLPDMIRGRNSPVENTDWDTDDPNINCYM